MLIRGRSAPEVCAGPHRLRGDRAGDRRLVADPGLRLARPRGDGATRGPVRRETGPPADTASPAAGSADASRGAIRLEAPSRAARSRRRPGAGSRASSGWCSSSRIGVALSHNRRAIRWRVVAWGLGLQVLFAIFVLRIPAGQALFRWLGDLVTGILGYSYIGSEFVFGELGKPNSSLGVIFAFQLLPGDHLRQRAVRHPVLPRHHAARGPGLRHAS